LTVNVSVILLVIFGILFFGESPLNAVQLLWVNLIMDTFAAIALSTEPPVETILREPPTTNSQILTPSILRQVMGISLWNFLITLGLFIFGPILLDLESFNYYGAKIHRSSDSDECEFKSIKELKKIKEDNKDNAKLLKDCEPYWEG
jgi:Ca2+ transporting ATPase